MSYLAIKLIPNEINFTLSRTQKLMIFLLAGFTSFLLMLFSVNLQQYIRVDLRHVVVVLLIYYFGPSFSIPITVFVSILRLYWGINTTSILSAIAYILVGVVIAVIYNRIPSNYSKYKTLLLFNSFFVLTSGLNLLYITHNPLLSMGVFVLILLTSSVVIVLNTLFIEDLIQSRQMFLNEKEYAKLDYLTGLLNMREFNKSWQLIQLDETLSTTAFLMLDIDHFKTINDTYGHVNGNLVLQQLAMILKINVPETQQIFRVGGEEFCLILTNCTTNELNYLAEKIRDAVASKPFQLEDDESVDVTVSIGLASTRNKDLKKLYRLADRCLYLAKDQGRNKVVTLAI